MRNCRGLGLWELLGILFESLSPFASLVLVAVRCPRHLRVCDGIRCQERLRFHSLKIQVDQLRAELILEDAPVVRLGFPS